MLMAKILVLSITAQTFDVYELFLFQMNVDPEDLIPKLPKPKDLQPFPTTQSIVSLSGVSHY